METDPQILGTLEDIRRLLQVLTWISAIIAAAVTVRLIIYAYVTWRQVKSEGLEALVMPHYRQGRLDRVVELCREELGQRPDNPYAHWYLGIVDFDRGSSESARAHFDRVLALVPSWRPSVEPYLQKLNNQPGG